ncbi:MAG: DUF1292 domain-containing protein [Candidatus Gastranaerophilales bacterium]|nr:DUF1292 domain-containing protein [Candidatus Gastranaerophilales bacterium]
MDNNEERIVSTKGEDGKVQNFEIVDVFTVEGQDYAALIPVDENGEEQEGDELILMRFIEENDDYTFEEIEDDEEFNKVAEAFENEFDDDDEE